MKYFVILLFATLIFIISTGLNDSSGLSIDPFETHVEINQTIGPRETVLLSMDNAELDKRLGFRLFQLGEDALKVRMVDPHGNNANVDVNFHVDESYGENGRVQINTEFEPKFSGIYKIELQNISDLPVAVNGYHGIMMSHDDMREISKKHGYDAEHNIFVGFVVIGLMGGAIGVGGGYLLFRLKRK